MWRTLAYLELTGGHALLVAATVSGWRQLFGRETPGE